MRLTHSQKFQLSQEQAGAVLKVFEEKFVKKGIDFSRAAHETAKWFGVPREDVLKVIPNQYWNASGDTNFK